MKSSQYIEDVAKSKLGLTYKNEIIFKERSRKRRICLNRFFFFFNALMEDLSENFFENHRKSDRICVIVCVLTLENNFLEVYHAYRTMENNGDRIADRKNDLCSIRAGGKYVMYHGILSGGAGILHGMLSG